jgi:deazaflavin-dependent oxidoreductase (nitroreductase family)
VNRDYAPSPTEHVADQVARYEATDGAEGGSMPNGSGVVILATRGRKTGKLRKTPLVKVVDGEDYIVIASMGGAPSHPLWYLNLAADPDVSIQDGAAIHQLRARTTSGTERERLWALAVEQWPDYADYAKRTNREIPVVICEQHTANPTAT